MTGIEEVAVNEWAQILSGVTGAQIKYGLDAWREDWPPSAPEFYKACIGEEKEKLNDLGLNYTPPYHTYVGQAERRQDHLLSNDDRDARRAKAREGIDAMRKALKGSKHG